MGIEVTNLKFGMGSFTEEVHFSGGLRGFRTSQGWALFPVSECTDSNALLFHSPESHFEYATKECRTHFIGTCIHYNLDENSPPMDVWEFGKRDSNNLNAADSWAAIASQAAVANDKEYELSAASVSVCLRVAGLRLRDISNEYHSQLKWALLENRKSGNWFSNAALLELYADFHSLLTELASARDHLAKLAAIHAGAPDRIDNLARLEDWLKNPGDEYLTTQPLVALLQSASGTKSKPNWLRRLGDIRNEMLHRIPMGANKSVSALVLQDINTSQGIIKTIRLADPHNKKQSLVNDPEPFIELSQLSASLEMLCRAAWKYAKYPPELPNFVASRDS